MTGGALDLRTELGGSKTGGAYADKELGDLGQTDKGQAEGNAGQVRDGRLRNSSCEPSENVEAMSVVAGETLLDGILAKFVQERLHRLEKRLNQRAVGVEEVLKLLEVGL